MAQLELEQAQLGHEEAAAAMRTEHAQALGVLRSTLEMAHEEAAAAARRSHRKAQKSIKSKMAAKHEKALAAVEAAHRTAQATVNAARETSAAAPASLEGEISTTVDARVVDQLADEAADAVVDATNATPASPPKTISREESERLLENDDGRADDDDGSEELKPASPPKTISREEFERLLENDDGRADDDGSEELQPESDGPDPEPEPRGPQEPVGALEVTAVGSGDEDVERTAPYSGPDLNDEAANLADSAAQLACPHCGKRGASVAHVAGCVAVSLHQTNGTLSEAGRMQTLKGTPEEEVQYQGQNSASEPAPAQEVDDRILEHAAMLQKVPLLQSLAGAERQKIAACLVAIEFDEGEAIVTEGEAGDAMYILESGTAQAFVQGCVVVEYEPGAFFGELALLSKQPRAAIAAGESVTECHLH